MKRLLVATGLACVLSAGLDVNTATAQVVPALSQGQWYVSPMVGVVFDDKDRLSDPGLGLSLGLGNQFAPHWAAELNLLGVQLDGFNEVNQYGAGLDFIGRLDPVARVTPYGVIGINYLMTDVIEGPGGPRGRDDDDFAGNWGLGLMARVGTSALMRFEARQRYTFADPDELSDILVNIGLILPLGGAAAPAVEADADGDGVPDSADRCPGTPPGAAVDASGCEDSDGDGVPDNRDRCPGTPRGAQVGTDGCELPKDADGDGVTDDKDQCPGTPRGVRVDHRGCEITEEIQLPGVNFEFDSARLTADSSETLDGAVSTLNRYPELHVECSGHTDATGSDAYNQDLSERRAHSVCEYLINKGIDRARLTEAGYGESRPVADNATEAGRSQNRRVALRITGGA